MSPNQMQLWLMKFDEEEQQRQQQYAMFQQANAAGLQQAMAAHRQTQQGYAAINQAETAAAQNAQGQINEQREAAQNAQENKKLDQSGPYPYSSPYVVRGLMATVASTTTTTCINRRMGDCAMWSLTARVAMHRAG